MIFPGAAENDVMGSGQTFRQAGFIYGENFVKGQSFVYPLKGLVRTGIVCPIPRRKARLFSLTPDSHD